MGMETDGARGPSPARVVAQFWELMRSNDFTAVGSVLADEFVCEWPQSRELVRGRENFAAINAGYPTGGRWEFDVRRVVTEGKSVVTETVISDGTVSARAISFFTVGRDTITHLREFWPDDYEAPVNRAHLVERLE